ncbi:hypothetical protein KNHN1_24510 [Pseudomonas guariconensis]|uniref:hypothetical protein n=1 Tax=Pseudomonas guariconensis TaxID=1288410 RepID=UPI0036F2CF30
MAAQYGARTRDSASIVTLDTTITTVRSAYTTQVKGTGSTVDQYFSIPQIKATSFVVVAAPTPGSQLPAAWWSVGQLQLRRPSTSTFNVTILEYDGLPDNIARYGLRARNDSSSTQIDNANRVLTLARNGSFTMGVISPGNIVADVTISFGAPITTTTQPFVFLNFDDDGMVYKFVLRGSPGNWTGFSLSWWTGQNSTQRFTVKWMAGVFSSSGAPGDYGLRVRDAAGAQLFVTSDNLILMNGFPSNDRFIRSGTDIPLGPEYYTSYRMPWTSSLDDYFLANSLIGGPFFDGFSSYDNPAGFLSANRSFLQAYSGANAQTSGSANNGRTLFSARPMRPI